MKTRIDIISGYQGSGKSSLIRRMMALGDNGRIIAFSAGDVPANIAAAALERIVRQDRPNRIVLESTGLLEEFLPLLERNNLASQAYAGTQALVLDGSSFLSCPGDKRLYYELQLSNADIVFINRTETLAGDEKIAVLTHVWEINRRVQLMVEPLDGIDIWRIFDTCANQN